MPSDAKLKACAPLLMVTGAKGAVGSTLAVAVAALKSGAKQVAASLTTRDKFSRLGSVQDIDLAGWDSQGKSLPEVVQQSGILPATIWKPYKTDLESIPINPPPQDLDLEIRVNRLMQDMLSFSRQFSDRSPVLINLLPAFRPAELAHCRDLSQLYTEKTAAEFPDIAYLLAALQSGIPVVNFTPNEIEIPVIIREAERQKIPLAGRDGKTGQTYLKVVLASALKARSFLIDGWYSLNILGNADGENLMDPGNAAGKMANKTELLDEILGYSVGEAYGVSTHKVHIDYYPPRGDAKEAWDVIDFKGLFGLPMSIRLNLMGRDSILAAPLAIDLARWMTVLKFAGYSGPVPELGLYFKKPIGQSPPLTFQDQVMALENLEKACNQKINP
jgi:myo-inositol-1-phosphate synthase